MVEKVVEKSGRANQTRRTRKDLLRAAARMLEQGRAPSLDEIAEEALVSRATAYRYFPGVEALLAEAALDVAVPEPQQVFDARAPQDVVARLERVDDVLDQMIATNEPALRLMLANSLQRSVRGESTGDVPLRQNRRTPLIEAALAPARQQFRPAMLATLAQALAVVVGTESTLVFKDVLQVDDAQARKVKRWMIRALVQAARKSEQ
jgi:AcrR family transcriptional regulator